MRIDAHQHFWKYDPAEYPWMQPEWPIRRDFGPAELEPLLKQYGFDGCIAVQARQTLEETRWLLELAQNHHFIKGVVGWVDLRSERLGEDLARFQKHPAFVGVRHVVQDESDDRFMLRPDFLRGIGKLKQFNLTYDILIFPPQLPAAIELVKTHPDQPFVLDHLAKPYLKQRILSPWREQIQELASHANVSCKISGLVTEAHWNAWTAEDFRPYLDFVLEAFGVDRLMFGSDWPVCLLAGTYEQVFSIVQEMLASLPDPVKSKILGENAQRFYLGNRANPP